MPRETSNFTPRFRTLADELIQRYQAGEFSDGGLLPSERELGLEYGLSRQTIRNALDIMAKEGWVVSRAGKGRFLRQETEEGAARRERVATRQIGLICRASIFLEDMGAGHPLIGLKSAFSEHGYTLSMSIASKDLKLRLHPLYPRWLKEDMMDGYVLMSAPPHVQERLARENTPTVSLGYLWTDADIPSVEMDFREIHRRAVGYLAEQNLLPTCALVAKEKTVEETKFLIESMEGHTDGVRELALGPDQAPVVRFNDSAYDLVVAIRRLFRKGAGPRSLILGSGRFVEDVLVFLDTQNLRVPEDVSLLLIDPSNCPAHCLPRVARFESDAIALARRAGEKLLEIIDTGKARQKHERLALGRFVGPAIDRLR